MKSNKVVLLPAYYYIRSFPDGCRDTNSDILSSVSFDFMSNVYSFIYP